MSLTIYLDHPTDKWDAIYRTNITHNLSRMASELGIYSHLWHPNDVGIKTAGQLIMPIRLALSRMIHEPLYYMRFNAENGWGTFKDFMPWLEKLLKYCNEYPYAILSTIT